MSLTDSIAAAGDHALDEHGSDWIDKATGRARLLIADRRDELKTSPLPSDVVTRQRQADELRLLGHAEQGLSVVEAHAPALVTLTRGAFAAMMIQLGAGREDEARRLYLATRATLRERLQASANTTAATEADAEAHALAAKDTLDGLEELGGLAIKAALPFLMATL